MKVKVLYFKGDTEDPGPYFHLCTKLQEFNRFYRAQEDRNRMSIMNGSSSYKPDDEDDFVLEDKEMFDYLMDKFGTLEGTYAEWEL